jgi:protein-disulfide isomerase
MKKDLTKKVLIGVFSILVISSLVGTLMWIFPQRQSPNTAIQKALDYINQLLASQGQKVELISWEEESGLYKIRIKIGDKEYESFVTKDGKFLFPVAYDLTQKIEALQTQPKKVEKKEKPDVKLFVMSYCPFGLQMEKAILPVWQLLKDKADIGIYFVDYIMHGKKEMEENLRQYCIQKEEKEKYLAYLSCFVKDGDFESCLKEAKIDQEKLNSCVEFTDKEFKISENFKEEGYPPFNVHKDLNEKYGVKGSPTLVINDVLVQVERSPEKVKEAICNAFSNPPSECQKQLSTTPTSPGFGLKEGSSNSSGSCQ